ncbi:MAG: hypothetical protein JWO53_405 [Chlamydiia bacterium]|nr:hypothetical protein [Chlamydiia bacterium]
MQQKLFSLLFLFIALFTFQLPAEEVFEDNCGCYETNGGFDIYYDFGTYFPGVHKTDGYHSKYDLERLRAIYNTKTRHLTSTIYEIPEDVSRSECIPQVERQQFRDERQKLLSIHEEKTGYPRKYFAEYQGLLDYATQWIDLQYRWRIAHLKAQAPLYPWARRTLDADLEYEEDYRSRQLVGIEEDRQYVSEIFNQIYAYCQKQHTCLRTHYENGLQKFAQGEIHEGLRSAATLIELSRKHNKTKFTTADTYFKYGMEYAQAHEFGLAIDALTVAIELDPTNVDAHIERAACLFEVGEFDAALKDLTPEVREKYLKPVHTESALEFNTGFLCGYASGTWTGIKDIPESLLYSVKGISQALWAGVKDPLAVPQNLYDSYVNAIEFIKKQDLKSIAHLLAPEAFELIKDWDTFDSRTRGNKLGFVIGKYGFEIFTNLYSGGSQKAFQAVRRTNIACNLNALTSSGANKAQIIARTKIIAQKRNEFLVKSYQFEKLTQANASRAQQAAKLGKVEAQLSSLAVENLAIKRQMYFNSVKLQKDCQGKHIKTHHSYNNLDVAERGKKSILDLSMEETEAILKRTAGTGKCKKGSLAMHNYQEIVDCGKEIGAHIDPSGIETRTRYATIHYRKRGEAHLVPEHPNYWESCNEYTASLLRY